MENSNITLLKEGVYELEKGNGERLPSSMAIARLKYGETGLQKFSENAHNLPSGLEENVLEILSVTHDGSYADGKGERKLFPEVAFGFLKEMTLGQKVLIHEMEDGTGEEGEKQVRMYVIKLLEYLQLEIPTPTEACLGMHLNLLATINSSQTTLEEVVAFARLVDEDDEVISGNTSSQFMENVYVTGEYDLACNFSFKIPMLRLGTVRVRLVFVQLINSGFAKELRFLGHADSAQILVQDNENPKMTAD